MKLSLIIAQGTDGWKIAKRADELGYHAVWFEDSQMLVPDPIVMMTVAAMHTSRIKLGTGVLMPSNRIAPQTANSFASLNSFAPGRINLGIGSGFGGRRTMGLGAYKVDDMRAYVEVISALLRNEIVEWEFENKRRKIRFLNSDKNLMNLSDPIDIYLAAQGPKMRHLTAELKAQWMSIFSTMEAAAADFEDMRRARVAAGSQADAFKSAITFFGYPLADGEACDSPRAKRQVGPLAAIALHGLLEMEDQVGALGIQDSGVDLAILEKARRVYRSYEPADARYLSLHRGHALFVRDEEKEFITADWIRRTTLARPVPELREIIRELGRIGYQEIVFLMNTLHPSDIDILEQWIDVMEGV